MWVVVREAPWLIVNENETLKNIYMYTRTSPKTEYAVKNKS